jgi:hypothetical protein
MRCYSTALPPRGGRQIAPRIHYHQRSATKLLTPTAPGVQGPSVTNDLRIIQEVNKFFS